MIELKTVNAGLKKDLGDVNLLALPRLEKVVLNCGIGRMKDDKGFVGSKQRACTHCQKTFN